MKSVLFVFILSISVLTGQEVINFKKIDSLESLLGNVSEKDSLLKGEIYYKLGGIYRKSFYGEKAYKEYFKAEKIFKALGDDFNYAKTLYNIAVVQKNEKDFTASEVTSIEALTILNKLEQSNEVKKFKCYVYNNLGIIFDELEQFEKSIDYYKKAINLNREYEERNSFYPSLYKNNLAFIYKRLGKYELAIQLYKEIISNKDLATEKPSFYAMALNNYANSNYLNGNIKNIPELYFKAFKLIDSSNYRAIEINKYLAEYYNDERDSDSAKYYAYKAKRIAQNYSNDEILNTILLLSKIEEGEKSVKHLRDYIRLSDSLKKVERNVRNKFARIRFETNEIEQENIRIARERMWLVVISVILIIAGALSYIVFTQRAKNKELLFAKQQQETNEEIYNLMLGEHEKIEEARASEKRRISEELHDGVLGRLFGARLSLDSLNMNNSAEAIHTRGEYISELKTIENDIRKVSHELNTDFVSGSGFIDILTTMVEGQTEIYGLKYKLQHDTNINWDAVNNKYKIHIYRILQETLHNIYKHAQATSVNISITLKNSVICFTVIDNGAGFDVTKAKTGIGLKNMRSRIREIQGVFDITSEKDVGTTVSLEVPIKYDE